MRKHTIYNTKVYLFELHYTRLASDACAESVLWPNALAAKANTRMDVKMVIVLRMKSPVDDNAIHRDCAATKCGSTATLSGAEPDRSQQLQAFPA